MYLKEVGLYHLKQYQLSHSYDLGTVPVGVIQINNVFKYL